VENLVAGSEDFLMEEKGRCGDGKIRGWALDRGARGGSWSQGNPRESSETRQELVTLTSEWG